METMTAVSILFEIGIIVMAFATGFFAHEYFISKKLQAKYEERHTELERRLLLIEENGGTRTTTD